MTITIKINTDNAAFEDKDAEVARIMAQVCREFYSYGPQPSRLRDSNGNTVGSITVRGR
jgi:hypothetical protein